MEKYYAYASEFEKVYRELLYSCNQEQVVQELAELRWYTDIRMKNTLLEIGVFKIDFFDIKDYSFNWDKLKKFGLLNKSGGFLLESGYCVPIRDIEGNLLAIVGYYPGRPTASKYITAKGRYFHKAYSLFNIDNAVELSNDFEYLYVVEGIFDTLAIRSLGLPCVGLQGSLLSEVAKETINFFRKKIPIPDNDEIGKQEMYKWGIQGNTTYVEIKGCVEIDDKIKIVKDVDDLIKYFDGIEEILLEYKSSSSKYEILEV